ncbi:MULTISPECIES: hypothetical protein [Bacillota]|uniref:hypothetical protein n=1 Tax=Bacillota TaxID=1239 RepID=UPI00129DDF13|nr:MULTISPECIES: hypothetical protein [Bacillota]MCC4394841.1 hypothetical protein [Limosilactobacillus reuteri]MCC4402287.1 hypothetical protein [Limosilactobacillus reuteri]MRN06049.1 hypothetical protein [Lactobacillus sp. 0.1XD8-4]WLR79486.1 hypothetical protein Q3A95_09950 [Limosilactobacillus reuteri]
MSFSNIKSFIKENWAALVTFLLGFGQLYLFTCFLQQIAHLSKHSDKVNNTFLMILGGSWLLTLALSIVFPIIIISHQAYKIKNYQRQINDIQSERSK